MLAKVRIYFDNLDQWFSTDVPQEFLKHVITCYLVLSVTSFPLDCQIKKNDNSQHNSCPVWLNKKLYLFFIGSEKIYFLVYCRVLVISLYVPRWKRLKIADLDKDIIN